MRESWKRLRYRLEHFGFLAATRLIPRLPRMACVRLSLWLGVVAYYVDAPGRRVALANLEAAFPGRYSPGERRAIARRSYQGFARTMLDLLWAPRLTDPKTRGRYLQLEGAARLHEILDEQGSGAVFLCTHMTNFEWANLGIGFAGFHATMVAQALKNPLVGDFFPHLRQLSGIRIIPQERSAVRLLKHIKKGGAAGMLVDLNLKPTQASTVIEAFGLKMCVTLLHALLVQRGGALLTPVEPRALPDGSTRLIFHPPLAAPAGASLQEIAQLCWDFYEPMLRENPHLWIWSYKHWRYKPAETAREYPFYANVSSNFQKLLHELEAPERAMKS